MTRAGLDEVEMFQVHPDLLRYPFLKSLHDEFRLLDVLLEAVEEVLSYGDAHVVEAGLFNYIATPPRQRDGAVVIVGGPYSGRLRQNVGGKLDGLGIEGGVQVLQAAEYDLRVLPRPATQAHQRSVQRS